MRATQSDDTVLDGVIIPDQYMARVVPAAAAGMDAFGLAMFAWALLGFANVYTPVTRYGGGGVWRIVVYLCRYHDRR